MSFGEVVAKTWRENVLFSALIELTYRCNLDCFFCYNDVGLAGKPLSRADYFQLLEDLAAMQVMNLTLSGGEPLAHPDFLLLGAKARELGFVVRIKSNGHALRGELLRRVKDEIDPFIVEVSLHGSTAATHDRQTRIPGSFDRLLSNLREMADVGVRVKVNSTLTAWNEGEIEAMMDLVESLGLLFQVDPEVSPRDDGDRDPLSIAASREGILRLYRVQDDRARRAWEAQGGAMATTGAAPAMQIAKGGDDGGASAPAGKHCGAGSSIVCIDPYGNVYPCVQWRRPAGNLHERRIGEIWTANPVFAQVRELTTATQGMVAGFGASGAMLAFCPGSAETRTGDPLAVYPAARLRMELAEEVLSSRSEGKRILLPVVG